MGFRRHAPKSANLVVHAAQSFDGYSGFGLALRMAARSQRVADNALAAADLHLDL
jgi:hypothetical protein